MATPIPELIAEELVTRLTAITEENGYEFTVPSVDRVNRDGRDWTPKHHTITVVQGNAEREPAADCPGNPPADAYTQPFMITGFVRKPEREDFPDQWYINHIEAAIRKAVAEGSTTWYTLGAGAYNAHWGDTEYFRSPSSAGVRIELRVQYRVNQLDPFEVRA